MSRHSTISPLLVLVLVTSALVAQGTDECSSPLIPALSLGATMGSNVGATTSAGFTPICSALNSDVWFTFTPAISAVYQFDTNNGIPAGSLTDTVLGIYAACAPGPIACDDDSGANNLSLVLVALTAGTTYFVQVGDFGASVTTGSFWINVTFVPPPPANDTCATAIVLAEGTTVAGTTISSTTGPDPLGTCAANSSDVWYVFVPSCSGPYRVTTCAAVSFDEVVTVWDGTSGCGALIQVGCDDDGCGAVGGPSHVLFTATAGVTYYVSVAGFAAIGDTGSFHITVAPGPAFSLSFFSPGPMTIGYAISGGPPVGGASFTAISLVAGLFPFDWFHGIAISLAEINSQVSFGFPFTTPLMPCGSVTVGPFGPVPTGLSVYAVSFGFAPGSPYPSMVSAPVMYTVP
jgi:hypothetical protein